MSLTRINFLVGKDYKFQNLLGLKKKKSLIVKITKISKYIINFFSIRKNYKIIFGIMKIIFGCLLRVSKFIFANINAYIFASTFNPNMLTLISVYFLESLEIQQNANSKKSAVPSLKIYILEMYNFCFKNSITTTE